MKNNGGRRSTTWPKGKKPPVQKPKGSKHKSTLLKESIGLDNWQELANYMKDEGAAKMVSQLKKLSGRNYFTAYSTLLEFFEPKKQRIQAQVEHSSQKTFLDFLKETSVINKPRIPQYGTQTAQL
jgi:hypothetical protein